MCLHTYLLRIYDWDTVIAATAGTGNQEQKAANYKSFANACYSLLNVYVKFLTFSQPFLSNFQHLSSRWKDFSELDGGIRSSWWSIQIYWLSFVASLTFEKHLCSLERPKCRMRSDFKGSEKRSVVLKEFIFLLLLLQERRNFLCTILKLFC